MKNRKYTLLLLAVLLLLALLHWGNTAIGIQNYRIESHRIPDAFSGFRIAQISDLHNAEFGKGNEKLLRLLSQAKPDITVITGDLVDSRRTDKEVALEFCKALRKLSPVYYVTGNHESRISDADAFQQDLAQIGVTVLAKESVRLEREGETIFLMGIPDPSFETDYLFGDAASVVQGSLRDLCKTSGGYRILLSHRPELFDIYAQAQIDLVFTGHAHGGQIRLPFLGGLAAPNQGLFPRYDAGLFTMGETNMIVSRGLGNSLFPLRINNPPEIVIAELVAE